MKPRPLVFITCPLTPRSDHRNHAIEYLQNCKKAFQAAASLIRIGFAVYCPANDFPYWWVTSLDLTAEEIYEQDLSIIAHSNAVLALGNCAQSENCMRELGHAQDLEIPIFYTIGDLADHFFKDPEP